MHILVSFCSGSRNTLCREHCHYIFIIKTWSLNQCNQISCAAGTQEEDLLKSLTCYQHLFLVGHYPLLLWQEMSSMYDEGIRYGWIPGLWALAVVFFWLRADRKWHIRSEGIILPSAVSACILQQCTWISTENQKQKTHVIGFFFCSSPCTTRQFWKADRREWKPILLIQVF